MGTSGSGIHSLSPGTPANSPAIHARFAEVRDSHPEWAGKTAVVGRIVEGEFSAFNKLDIRAKFLNEFGFGFHPHPAGDNWPFFNDKPLFDDRDSCVGAVCHNVSPVL